MKKKIVIGIIIFLLVAVTAGMTIYRNSKPAFKTLKGTSVTKGSIGEEVFASGRLELSDKTEVNAPFAAKVKAVSVKLGEQVQAGQTLFEMDTEDLRKQLDAAKLSLADAKASLDSAKLSRAYALEDAKQAVDDASAILDRVKNGEVVPGTLGTPVSLTDAQANYDKVKKNYDRLVINPSSGQMSITALENNVKRADTNVKELQQQLNSAVVKAPVAGTVVELTALAGAGSSGSALSLSAAGGGGVSQAGAVSGSLVTLANLDKLRARVKVNELDSTKVKVGQKVKVTSDTVDKEFAGSVESVAPVAVTSGSARGEETTVEVTLTLDDSNGLKPGYNVNVVIKTSESIGVLLVPSEAVVDLQGKKFVFIEENGEARQREVSTGLSDEQKVEVKTGVKEGDKVVLSPPPNLKEGDKVKVNE